MSTLVVPIDLAALCVGRPDTQGVDPGGIAMGLAPAADFSKLPYTLGGHVHNRGPYLSAAALAAGAPFGGAVPLLHGIHLHWALPDGLTHARRGEAALDFPCAPDRWLLTRVLVDTRTPDAPALRSWVVESDRLNPHATAPAGLPQPTVPGPPTPGPNFAFLGQAFPLDEWQEQGDAVDRYAPLTAVGYGEPTFAAMYSNSSSVFGFLDTLADVSDLDPAHTTVSYHVAGWYAAAGADPLASGTVDPQKNRYRWRWPTGDEPTATMCSGVIGGIPWDPGHAYLTQPPEPLTVAIGGSGPEALSALMAAVLDPELYPDAEQLLDALQFGHLSRQGEVDGLVHFDEAIHAAGFARLHGGWHWAVTHAPNIEEPDQEELAAPLATLDALQAEYDALLQDVRAGREQLFSDWCKYLLCQYDPTHVPPPLAQDVGAVRQYLQTELAQLAAITMPGGRLDRLATELAELAEGVNAGLPVGIELAPSSPAARYFQPADPVLVLSGPDTTPPARYGRDGAGKPGGYLPCRLDGELVSGATLAAGLVPGSEEAVLPASALPGLSAHPADAPIPLVEALLREALLLTAAAQPVVAAAVAALGGPANPATLDFAGTVGALTTAAADFLAGVPTGPVTYAGTAPDALMVATWTGTPWLPVRLDYDIGFAPVQLVDPEAGAGPYPPDFINANFAFDAQAVDLQYTGTPPPPAQAYLGTAILTPGAAVDLIGELRRYLDHTGHRDEELESILADLRTLPILAQRLTGALEAMLMRSLELQLPVADPLAPGPLAGFNADVAAAVGDDGALGPLPDNCFNPIRAGGVQISKLRLVDAFGRFKDYPAPPVVVAHALAAPAGSPPGTAFLRPRIGQPARLRLDWLPAGGMQTTPIAGWLLPLWLDRAIGIYRADGTALGEIALNADRTRALWTPAPGGAWPPETPIEQVMVDEQPDLRDVALTAYNGGDATFLAPFFDVLEEALNFSLPATFRESAEAAVLAGQPLAIGRIRLGLELAGPPASNQSWTSFAGQVLDDLQPDDGGLASVRFPVVLGSVTRLDDTLVGYWLPSGEAIDYGTFYAPSATAAHGGVRPPDQDTVTLTPTGPASATMATVLFDPRGTLHAITGILPARTLRVPPALYGAALRTLVPTLAARPLLSGAHAGPLAIPLPKLDAGAWSWIGVANDAWAPADVTDAPASATLGYSPQTVVEGWLRHD